MEWKKILKEDKGIGDTISRITKKVGIKECGGCQKRKATLNRRFPYGHK
tara:strand:+ start:18346 stop:18492 length:147 start_codon:yes stop_codon:yes gene_type:complete